MDAHNLSCLLLCSNSKNSKQLEIDELHINFWDFDNEYIIMDIGLLINIPKKFDNLKNDIAIHIPGKFEKNNVIDLGNLLSNDIDIVSAIFNDNIDLFQKTNQLTYFRRYESNKRDKYKNIILLPLDKDIFKMEINDDSNSSSIIIELSTYLKNEKSFIREIMRENSGKNSYIYIRFRLSDVKKTKFISDFKQKDSAILSSSIKSKIFDFRVNENRWIPKKWQRNLLTIKKMHCFFIISRKYELNHSSKNFVGSRSLIEEPIWNKYLIHNNHNLSKSIPTSQKNQFNMGYHWKVTDNHENFSVLGRFSVLLSSIEKIILSVFFVIILSIFSNFASSYMEKNYPFYTLIILFIFILFIFILIIAILIYFIIKRIKNNQIRR